MLEDEFGDIIRKARLGLELSLATVAAETHVPVADLEAWEKYQGGPEPEALGRLAVRFNLPVVQLADSLAVAYEPESPPDQVEGIGIRRIAVTSPEGYAENCYLWRWSEGLLVVDPGYEPETILAAIRAEGVPVQGYLITHHHGDHIGALPDVHALYAAPVWVHELEKGPLIDLGLADFLELVHGGETLHFGSQTVTVLHTPGHTAGGVTYRLHGIAAVGDVLFAGSVGRSFMGHGGYEILLHTVRDSLLKLPEATVLCPGHGPMTTVAEECRHNPFA